MVSEFRKKKLVKLFQFLDRDSSNFIEKKDFELAAERTSQRRGWKAGDAKYKETEELLLKIWDSLQSHADKDKDGKVTIDEWLSMWDSYAKNPSAPLEWQNLYAKFIFQLQDAGDDGAIDAEEFTSVFESFGMDKSAAATAFQKLSSGKANITWEEFQELWKEYFVSDDPNAPGNFIFGTLTA